MKKDNILVVGAGAIGSFYGALLAKSEANVSMLCRSDYDTVINKGYTINSDALGNWVFKPAQIIKACSEYKNSADYVILCTKNTPETNRVQLIQNVISQDTCIVLIQNGINIEQEIIDAFPNNEVVSGLAFICCNRLEPGVIHHLAYGKLTLGSLNKKTNKAQHLSDLINQSGIESTTTDNIITSRWLKCLWNAAFNPLSVLSDGLSTQEILSSQEKLIRTIMQEVSSIAHACGHPLPEDSIDININNTYDMPAYKTSMLLDYENQKPMEIEAILGNTINVAQQHHVNCPTLDTLYALLKLKCEISPIAN